MKNSLFPFFAMVVFLGALAARGNHKRMGMTTERGERCRIFYAEVQKFGTARIA